MVPSFGANVPINLPGRFKDRYDAARRLLPELAGFAAEGASMGRNVGGVPGRGMRKSGGERVDGSGTEAVAVLAIPRGGLQVGAFLARELGRPLDVALAKKLPAPGAEELAVGAVTLDGVVEFDTESSRELGADESYVADRKAEIVTALEARDRAYHARVPRLDLKGATALLVDDGIATGLTTRAAVGMLRRLGAARVAVAAPVASAEAVAALRGVADEVVALKTESPFYAVGTYYENFPQVEDSEAVRLLEESRS